MKLDYPDLENDPEFLKAVTDFQKNYVNGKELEYVEKRYLMGAQRTFFMYVGILLGFVMGYGLEYFGFPLTSSPGRNIRDWFILIMLVVSIIHLQKSGLIAASDRLSGKQKQNGR